MTTSEIQDNRLQFIHALEELENKAYSGLTAEEYNAIRIIKRFIIMRYNATVRGDD